MSRRRVSRVHRVARPLVVASMAVALCGGLTPAPAGATTVAATSTVMSTVTSTTVTSAAVVARGAKIITIGRRYLGIRYRAGGTSPRTGFDCSGFVRYVYGKLHIYLPRVSRAQARYVRRISRSQAVPGDLVFFHSSSGRVYHVALYAGHGRVLHSPHTGSWVKFERIWTSKVYYGRVRWRR